MWFDSLSDIVRVLAVGAAAYLALVVLLRVSGKRTLAKLNAFDWVVSVAFGSTLATILLNSSVSLSEGVVALLTLAALQYLVATATTHVPGSRSIVTAEPTLLLRNGAIIDSAVRRQRLTVEEVLQTVRSSSIGDVSHVAAVVLETDGSLSVIPSSQAGDWSTLAGVDGVDLPR